MLVSTMSIFSGGLGRNKYLCLSEALKNVTGHKCLDVGSEAQDL